MKLTEQEQAALSVSADAISHLIAMHETMARDVSLGGFIVQQTHKARAEEWKRWRNMLRDEQYSRECG